MIWKGRAGGGARDCRTKPLSRQEKMIYKSQKRWPKTAVSSAKGEFMCVCAHSHIFTVYSPMSPLLSKLSFSQNHIHKAHFLPGILSRVGGSDLLVIFVCDSVAISVVRFTLLTLDTTWWNKWRAQFNVFREHSTTALGVVGGRGCFMSTIRNLSKVLSWLSRCYSCSFKFFEVSNME